MAVRILPVRERAVRAIVAALRQITVANGYNTTVRNVRRNNSVVVTDPAPPAIHLMFGASHTRARGSADKWTSVELDIRYFIQKVAEEADTESNFFMCDIMRRIEDGIVDSSNPSRSYALDIEPDSEEQPLYWEGDAGNVIGQLKYRFTYSWCKCDNRKWDSNDTHVTA